MDLICRSRENIFLPVHYYSVSKIDTKSFYSGRLSRVTDTSGRLCGEIQYNLSGRLFSPNKSSERGRPYGR